MKKIFTTITLLFLANMLFAQTIVKLQKANGVYLIPCKINGKSLSFIFDTGASDVLLSLEEAKKLYDDGLLKKTDFLLETENYQTASGDIVENKIVYIRNIEINGLVLNNIKASISSTAKAPLLLGQSALSKFGEFTFNYQNNTLSINSNSNVDLNKRIEEAKAKMLQSGMKMTDVYLYSLEKTIKQEKIKQEINLHLDFEVIKIIAKQEDDGLVLIFDFDVTNESDLNFTQLELGIDHIYIDVITEDGKTYSTNVWLTDVLAKKTIRGNMGNITQVNIRNKKPKYFRIYPLSASSM